jgi:hypothetical protein
MVGHAVLVLEKAYGERLKGKWFVTFLLIALGIQL